MYEGSRSPQHTFYFSRPAIFSDDETALDWIAKHPNSPCLLDHAEDGSPVVLKVVFFIGRCPSCGRYSGTTDPGMPDPKKQGGAEHICWKCAEVFHPFIRQAVYIDQIRSQCSFVDERYYTRPRG